MRRFALLLGLTGCLPTFPSYKEDTDATTSAGDDGSASIVDADNDGYTAGVDCDDNDDQVYPGGTEICGGGDENCNGTTDEANATGCTTYHRDDDNDEYGVDGDVQCLCTPATPYTALDNADCDDTNASIHPNAPFVCGTGVFEACDEYAEIAACRWPDASIYEAPRAGGARFEGQETGVGIGSAIAAGASPDGNWVAIGMPPAGTADLGHVMLLPAPISGEYALTRAPLRDGDIVLPGTLGGTDIGSAVGLAYDLTTNATLDLMVLQRAAGDATAENVVVVVPGPFTPDTQLDSGYTITPIFSALTLDRATLLSPGDLNSDGAVDLLLSTNTRNDDSRSGSVIFIDGPVRSDRTVYTVSSSSVVLTDGLPSGFGSRIAYGTSADGAILMSISRPNYNSGRGGILLFSDADFRGMRTTISDAASLNSNEANARCGLGADFVDIDGDGHLELAIGCPGSDGGVGAVYVLDAEPLVDRSDLMVIEDQDASLVLFAAVDEDGFRLGESVVNLHNQDTIDGDELMVTLRSRSGDSKGILSFIHPSLMEGGTTVLRDASTSTYWGEEADDGLGRHVTEAVSLTDDDLPDLVVGVPLRSATAPQGGGLYVVPGTGP